MAQRKKTEDERQKELKRAYEVVSNTAEGLLVLQDVLALSGYDADTMRQDYRTGEINAYASLVNQGKRNIWCLIQTKLTRHARISIEIPIEEVKPARKRTAKNKEESTITELVEEYQEE